MGEIILVRHGQANSTATDEAGYDRLSDLGRRRPPGSATGSRGRANASTSCCRAR
jgi:broad specificity phosphatase PhoE